MLPLPKNEKRYRLLLAIAIGVAVGLLLILGIHVVLFYASDAMRALLSWLMLLLSHSAVPSFSTAPSVATSTFSSATYTELFSSFGFDDATNTTAYEDHVATSISLVPDFSVTPTTAVFTPAPVMPAGVPASENLGGATITKNGDIYTANIPAFPNLVVTSSYPGILRFGYDPSTQKTLIVYAAYESRVFEMGPTGAPGATGLIADYSARFGPPAFTGKSFGTRGVDPVIFSQDGAWWIFSGAGSVIPMLIKIQNGAVIDCPQTLFPDKVTMFAAAPGPAPHEIYVSDGSGSYLLTDNGFKQAAAQWVSSNLNQWDGHVMQGEVTSVDDSAAFDAGGASASIPAPNYFLSNDGGATWIAATPGEPVAFSTSGNDFRFKVELSPVGGTSGGASGASSADLYATPWVHIVRLEYWVARSAL